MATKKIKNRYIETLGVVVILLALARCAFPNIAENTVDNVQTDYVVEEFKNVDSENRQDAQKEINSMQDFKQMMVSKNYLAEGQKPHRIFSVPSYKEAFPDTNDLQLTAARKWVVTPVRNREDAEKRKRELFYIGSSPNYHVDPLHVSIPYLVPRAAILLQDIGVAFFDSLQVKGIPLHRLIVTSVLRSQADVKKLRNYNKNATEKSCHLYGTTFDICYNRYEMVEDPDGPARRQVRNDSLKYVLCEVLRDMRKQQRCYIKYEVKQGCFHMTVR